MTKNLKYSLSQAAELETLGFSEFGSIGRPHGIKGGFFLYTPDRQTHWDGYKNLLVETPTHFETREVKETYISAKSLVVVLHGIENRTQVEALYQKRLYVHQSEIKHEKVRWPKEDLSDYQVIDEQQRVLGTVIDFVSFGAQGNLVIVLNNKLAIEKDSAKDSTSDNKGDTEKIIYYPYVAHFIKNINNQDKQIEVVFIEEFFHEI